MDQFNLSRLPVQAILEMRLKHLTHIEREKIVLMLCPIRSTDIVRSARGLGKRRVVIS
jgi:hypothetical protein